MKIVISRDGMTREGYPWIIMCHACWNSDAGRWRWRRRTHDEARLRAVHHARNRHGVTL